MGEKKKKGREGKKVSHQSQGSSWSNPAASNIWENLLTSFPFVCVIILFSYLTFTRRRADEEEMVKGEGGR
jgi:hypothetical protein